MKRFILLLLALISLAKTYSYEHEVYNYTNATIYVRFNIAGAADEAVTIAPGKNAKVQSGVGICTNKVTVVNTATGEEKSGAYSNHCTWWKVNVIQAGPRGFVIDIL